VQKVAKKAIFFLLWEEQKIAYIFAKIKFYFYNKINDL
jgi:hypothetical protein